MTAVSFEVEGVDEFIREIGMADGRIDMGVRVDVRDSAASFTSKWKAHTRMTGKGYAKHYIEAIRPELTDDGLGAVIGPLSSMPQGKMTFEYGGPSVAKRQSSKWLNPPIPIGGGRFVGGPRIGQRVGQNAPHLDMNITADTEFPKFIKRVEVTVAKAWR